MTRPVYLGKLFTVQFDDALVSIGHLVTSLLPKLKQRHKFVFNFTREHYGFRNKFSGKFAP